MVQQACPYEARDRASRALSLACGCFREWFSRAFTFHWRDEARPNFYITRSGDFWLMKILFLIFDKLGADSNLSTSPYSFHVFVLFTLEVDHMFWKCTLWARYIRFLFHLLPTHYSIIVFPQSVNKVNQTQRVSSFNVSGTLWRHSIIRCV